MMIYRSIGLLGLLACAGVVEAGLATQCLRMINNTLVAYQGLVPCGVVTPNSGFSTCCNANGSTCLQDGLCMSPGTTGDTGTTSGAGGGFTGYYIGGCTDPSYSDASCNLNCGNLSRQDIVYDPSSKTWACCGTESDGETVNCDSPTNQDFFAAAPSALSATFTVGASAITSLPTSTATLPKSTATSSTFKQTSTPQPASSSSSQTASAAPKTQTSPPTKESGSGGLSTGAKAGIAVGCIAAALAGLVGLYLFIRRTRRQRGRAKEMLGSEIVEADGKQKYKVVEADVVPKYTQSRGMYEMPAATE